MKHPRVSSMIAALPLVLSAACAGETSAPESKQVDEAPAMSEAAMPSFGLRLEQAERQVDRGVNLGEAKATLEAILRDPTIEPGQRDAARLALSRALEALGDEEGAIRAVEDLLAEHKPGDHSQAGEAAAARLRKLLTGSEEPPRSPIDDAIPATPFARALTKYFPLDQEGHAEIPIVLFGGEESTSNAIGTFALTRALREKRREDCPLCDDKLNVHAASSRNGSWVSIPSERARLASSLVVFYFDLEDDRIPARYDALLPIPAAEIEAHLQKGEGLVAAREREGAPPILLIAAPRRALLGRVEEALAMMGSLPTSPTKIEIERSLRPQEIQGTMRASFIRMRKCYEALLTQRPTASGKIVLKFAIEPDGRVRDESAESEGGLRDATFERCMLTVAKGLRFPAAGARTTVAYPLKMTPD